MAKSTNQKTDQNVLDLRQFVAERRAAAEQPRRRWSGFKVPKPSAPKLELHRPAFRPHDWVMFKREILKFGLLVAVVGVVTGVIITATRVVAAKKSVSATATTGLSNLQDGLSALGQSNPEEAATHFSDAQKNFQQAKKELNAAVPLGTGSLPGIGKQVTISRRLLTNAEQMADVGRRLSVLIPPDALQQPAVTIQSDGIVQGSVGVLSSLLDRRDDFVTIVNDAVKVISDVETINPQDAPSAIRNQLISSQRLFDGLIGGGDNLDHLTSFLLGLLAPKTSKEYLVVFQNNDEIRATGGFLGTFLLVKFEQGTFKILDAPGNGPFALSDVIAKNNVPPQPVSSIAPFWTFHDSNWFLDVPTSAKTMLNFYEQDRGFAPDGVIMLTPAVMEDLLRITGPLRPPKYQIDISAENFVAATEQQVQFGYDKALNNPKQFLIDLVPVMIEKISRLAGPDSLRALALTMKNANQGNFLFYSSDSAQQKAIEGLGWDGGILPVNGDYLAVVDENLGGGKTDRSIDEKVKSEVTLDGAFLKHVVSVTRKHNGKVGDKLTGDTNKDFMRVYAPLDAQFIGISGATIPDANFYQASPATAKLPALLKETEGQTLVDQTNGYRITHESGRMVMGAWSMLKPGDSQTLVFTYTTPAPTTGTWNLTWQHQPGAPIRQWATVFNLPSGKKMTAASAGGKLSGNQRTVTFTSNSLLSRSFSATYK